MLVRLVFPSLFPPMMADAPSNLLRTCRAMVAEEVKLRQSNLGPLTVGIVQIQCACYPVCMQHRSSHSCCVTGCVAPSRGLPVLRFRPACLSKLHDLFAGSRRRSKQKQCHAMGPNSLQVHGVWRGPGPCPLKQTYLSSCSLSPSCLNFGAQPAYPSRGEAA